MKKVDKYLPKASIELISSWLKKYQCELEIKKPRKSKLGDYQFCQKLKQHKISINQDLNKYAFLLTITHEIAHMMAWDKYQNTILPHGKEWKDIFKNLMLNFLFIFPNEITKRLANHLKNPKSSTCYDFELSKSLRKFDNEIKKTIVDVPIGSCFKISNGKKFIKLKKLRKRYQCKSMDNNQLYIFNPLAEIIEA